MVATQCANPQVTARAFLGSGGGRRILLVNRRAPKTGVTIEGAAGGNMRFLDQTMPCGQAASAQPASDRINLNGYAVAVVTRR